MKLSDYVIQRLAEANVQHVFFVPGGGAMHLNDSLGKHREITYVCNFHEHGSAVAAEAYAKATNNLGVALVTTGPGSTNCVTGCASAWVNSAPVLFLSGQVKRSDMKTGTNLRQLGLQEVDTVAIVNPITKYARTLTDPATIRYHIDKALHLAREGRPGPVWLDIPLDVQGAEIEPDSLEPFVPPHCPPPQGLTDQVAQVIDWLTTAQRPIILAGGGIRCAGAVDAFLQLVDRLGVPVATTWVGADLVPDDHRLYVGRPGAFASRGANFSVQNSDLLITIGARWDLATTGFAPPLFARAARRVAVDVDAAELTKLHDVVDLGVCADAAWFVQEMLRQTASTALPSRGDWVARCRAWRGKYPVVTPDMRGHVNDTSTYVFVERLGELLQGSDVVVEGSAGIHSEIFFLTFAVKAGQRVLADGSLGAMGYGVPAALGACLGANRRTILVDGDGSFMPNVQELQVISRLQLPTKMFVVNNSGYSSIRVSQQRWFGRLVAADPTSGLSLPSLKAVAGAFGIPFIRVEREAELDTALRHALSGPGPIMCDIAVPREEDRVPRLANYRRADGSMASKPIEDLFPFLEREEFLANMISPPLPE